MRSLLVRLICFSSLIAALALPQTANAALAITTPANLNGANPIGLIQIPLVATGGTGALTWSVSAGSLPAGLSIRTDVPSFFPAGTAAGIIGVAAASDAGTPYSFTLQVTDSTAPSPQTATLPVTLHITSERFKDLFNLPDAFANSAYNYAFTVLNGTSPAISLSPSSGVLPAGLSVTGGALTGTPTATGNFNFQLQIVDGSDTIFRNFNIKVVGPHITTAGNLPIGTQNTVYSGVTLASSGGSGTGYTYQITNGGLPQGLTLTGGVIAGTVCSCASPGRYAFSITVTDSALASYQQNFALYVAGSVPSLPSLGSPTVGDATVGNTYTASFAAGGTPPFTWNVTGLPNGMTFRTGAGNTSTYVTPGDVEIWGAPLATGNFTFTLTATDANAVTVSTPVTLRVSPLALTTGTQLSGAALNTALASPIQIRIIGGTPPYNAVQTFGTMPQGLTVNSSATGGNVTGTPTENGNFNPTIQTYDSTGISASLILTYNLFVSNSPSNISINNNSDLGTYTVGSSINFGLNACCVAGNVYNWSVSGGSLPAGLTLNASTGVLSTTSSPATVAAGTYTFTVKAADPATPANAGYRTFTLKVTPIAITTNSVPFANLSVAYNGGAGVTFTATGTSGTVNWFISSGSLPPGLTLSTAGLLSGTPTSQGQYNFTVLVVDASYDQRRSYTINVYSVTGAPPVTISSGASLGVFTKGDLEVGLNASGGNGTFTWTKTAGTLPPGLSIRSDISSFTSGSGAQAALIGVATTTGTYNFTLQAASASSVASQAFTLTIQGLNLMDSFNLPEGFMNSVYVPGATAGYVLTPVNATGAVTFALAQNNNLPPGLSLNSSTGRISGTPTATGNYGFSIVATDAGTTGSVSRSFNIKVSQIQITTAALLPNATQGQTYTQSLAATGGSGTVTFTANGLPGGLNISSGNVITGTVNSGAFPGIYSVNITASDGTNSTTKTFSIDVIATNAQLTRVTLGGGFTDPVVGNFFSLQVSTCCGGVGPYTWAASGLPAGLALRYAGSGTAGTASGTMDSGVAPGYAQIYGIPSTPGDNAVTVTVTDNLGATTSQTFNLHVSVLDETVFLNNGTIGAAYSQTLREIGGTPGYTATVLNGALPAGIGLGVATVGGVSTATLVGTPMESGSFNFTIRFTDSAAGTANTFDRAFFINIANASNTNLFINTTSIHPLVTGTSNINIGLNACCTSGPYSWAITLGALPSGLSLNASTGAITGTATPAGDYIFIVQVTDAAAHTALREFALQISSLAITTTSIPFGALTSSYGGAGGFSLAATGGTGTLTWSLAPFTQLPPGLTLSAGGVVSGIPTSTGQYAPTFVVTDTGGHSTSQSFQLNVYPAGGGPPVSISTGSSFGTWSVGEYEFELNATGGTGAYAWSLISGALPTGYAIRTDMPAYFSAGASAGLIGVGTVPGTYNFTLQVTSGTQTTSKAFSITIAALTTKEGQLPDAYVGGQYNGSAAGYTMTALNAAPSSSVTFTASPASCSGSFPTNCLPPGLSMSSSGAITGTATTPGAYSFNVAISDGTSTVNHLYGINSYAITITNAGVLPNATQGVAYSGVTLAATGGTGTLTWSANGLPNGFTLNSSTGVLSAPSGFSAGPGRYSVTVTVNDSNPGSAQSSVKRFALDVIGVPVTLPQLNLGIVDDLTFGAPASLSVNTNAGGTEPFTYTATGLPAGMTIRTALTQQNFGKTAGDGEIWGTPTTLGTFNVTVTATDANGVSVTAAFPLTVSPLAHTPSLPQGTLAIAYNSNLRVVGGTTGTVAGGGGPGAYSVIKNVAGFLPGGLVRTGLNVAGTPTENGGFNVTYKYQDSAATPNTLVRTDFFSIGGGANTFQINSNGNLGTITQNLSFSQTFTACCVPNNLTWTTIPPTGATGLPPGMTLTTVNSNGLLSGTPTTAGTYTFLVQADEALGNGVTVANTAYRQFTVVVTPLSLTSTTNLPYGNVGVVYSQTLTTTGAAAAMTWTPSANNFLPPGLTLSGNTLSGTPTSTGQFSFGLTGTDGTNTIVRQFTLNIYAAGAFPPLFLSTNQNLGPWSVGTQFVPLSATGGNPPYTYSLTPGANVVPGCRVQNGQPLPTNNTSFPSSVTGGYLCLVTTEGSTATSIRVTDSATPANTFDRAINVTVSPLLLTMLQTLPNATVGQSYTFNPASTGGAAAYCTSTCTGAFTFSTPAVGNNGSLANIGLSINSSTGVITGTPTTAGTFTATIILGNASLGSSTVSFNQSITVTPFAITTSPSLQGTSGTAFSQTIVASGCTSACTWSVVPGSSLPFGFSLTTVNGNGVLSTGTQTTSPLMTSFTLQVSNGSSSVQQIFSLVISYPTSITAALSVTTNISTTSSVGSSVSLSLTAAGGIAPYTFTLQSGTLPPGITLQGPGNQVGNLAPGFQYLAGRPALAGTYNFTLLVTDSTSGTPQTATKAFAWTISPMTFNYVNLPLSSTTLQYNVAYTQAMLVVGGSGSYPSWQAPLLPPGLSVSSSGVVSGTPSSTGNFSVPFTVTDSGGKTLTSNVNFNVSSVGASTVTLGGPASGTVAPLGILQNYDITPSGGIGPYTITAVGSLPTGVILENGTTLGGSFGQGRNGMQVLISTPGTYTFTLQATDSSSTPILGARTYTLVVPGFDQISNSQQAPNQLTPGTVSVAYSQQLYSFGPSSVTWSLTAGSALPPGLSISTGGLISGLPTAAGTYNFNVTYSDGVGSITTNLTLKISALQITSSGQLPLALQNIPYGVSGAGVTLAASGGSGSTTWAVTSGSLPTGLSLNTSTGLISGTVTGSTGAYSFTATATNTGGSISKQFTLFVGLQNPGILNYTLQASLSDAIVGQFYQVSLIPNGGAPPYTWTVASGSTLPPGLNLVPFSSISASFGPGITALGGVPTAAGVYSFNLVLTDSASATITRTFTLNVSPFSITAGNPPNARQLSGTPYSFQFQATGGTSPYTYSLAPNPNSLGQDALPAGLSLNSSGLLSGTPTGTGSFNFQLTVTDSAGRTLTRNLNITSTNSSGVQVTQGNGNLQVNGFIDQPLNVGGTGSPYTWAIQAVTPAPASPIVAGLPPGITLQNNSGAYSLKGNATAAGTYQFVLQATNGSDVALRTVTFKVSPISLTAPVQGGGLFAPILPVGAMGSPYSFTFAAAGGTPPYTYVEATNFSFPPGLTLNSTTGVLSGTPTQSGAYTIRPIVTDSTGKTDINTQMTLIVTTPTGKPSLESRNDNYAIDPSVGIPFTLPLNRFITPGVAPYTWTVTSGSMPPGLSLIAGSQGLSDIIGGTPTAAGDYNFTLNVADSSGQNLSIPVNGMHVSPMSLTPASLPAAVRGTSYSVALAVSGGTPPYSFKFDQNFAPPPGLSISGGILSGTPTYAGVFPIGFVVTDSAGGVANTLTHDYEFSVDDAAAEVPSISIAPKPVNILYIQGQGATAAPVTVRSSGAVLPFNVTLYGLPGTATLSANTGTTNSSVNLNYGSVPAGTYSGFLGVGSARAVNEVDFTPVNITVLTPPPCSYTLSTDTASSPIGGDSGNINISAGSTCTWTAAPDDPFITLTGPTSGTGNGTVSYSTSANNTGNPRTGTVTITGSTNSPKFTINQFAAGCSFSISPSTLSIGSAGGGATVNVISSGSACNWTASSLGATPASGTGSGPVSVTIPANANAGSQVVTATIAGQTFTVNQTGVSCTYALNASTALFDPAGGSGSVNVTAPNGCPYNTILGPSWIRVTSGASGTGTGSAQSLTYTVDANSTTLARTGALTIGGQTYAVTEQALACSVSADTSTLGSPFASGGGTGTIGITTNGSNCSWNAASNVGFATVSPPTGFGNGQVTVTASSNAASTSSRNGSLTVSGQTISFSQAGTTCSYSLRATSSSMPSLGGLGTISVVAPAACNWTATPTATPWLSIIASGNGGTSDVSFIAAANASATPRSGTITVAGQTFTVNEGGAPCTFTLASSSSGTLAAAGVSNQAVNFTASTNGCAVPAVTSYASWITASGTFADPGGTMTYSVAANSSGTTRTGNVQIGDKVFSVIQTGAACSYSMNAYGLSVNYLGASSNILGSANLNTCPDPPNGSTQPFVTVGGLTGTPALYTLPFTVSPFVSATKTVRQGLITFGGQLFYVKQTSF